MSNSIKSNQLNIITLNNKTYIPFQLHQLPSYYQEIPLSKQFSLKGYTYIDLEELRSFNKDITTFNHTLDGQYTPSK